VSYKDDVDEEACNNGDLSRGDRNGEYKSDNKVHGCIDVNDDRGARATRCVYTIYCATPSGRREVRSEKQKQNLPRRATSTKILTFNSTRMSMMSCPQPEKRVIVRCQTGSVERTTYRNHHAQPNPRSSG
jgi:predicted RNA-binding Zn-ribbon protein involved in translation (DUF1610 family)